MSDEKITGDSRIVLIDALRGFALLGILLSHFNHWYIVGPLPDNVLKKDYGTLSKITELINIYFISNKFYILFSFIFGLSFYLQTVSFKKYAKNIDLLFYRRAAFLFIIGAIHYSIWLGDILVIYAILMVPLILLRRLNDKQLLIVAVLFVINIPGIILQIYHGITTPQVSSTVNISGINPKAEQLFWVVSNGNFVDFIRYNISFIHTRIQYQVWSGSLFLIFGFFLLGMYTARKGWLQKTHLIKSKFKYIIPISFILLIGLQYLMNILNVPQNFNNTSIKIIEFILMLFMSIISVLMNISLISILFFNKLTLKFTVYLADLGRMALTNYLIQTIIGLFLFYHIGLALFTKTTPAANFIIAVFIFIFQLFFSNFWFKYFNYGIVEWLLRAGTLWKFKDLIKRKK